MKIIKHSLSYKILYGKENLSYNELEKELEKSLLQLNREDAIKCCLKINFDLFLEQDNPNISNNFINDYFNETGKRKIKQKLGFSNNLAPFSRGLMIELLYKILIHCPAIEGFKLKNGEYFKKHFRIALLIVSDLRGDRLKGSYKYTADLKSDSENALPAIIKSLPSSNHIDFKANDHLQVFYRGYSIFVELFSEKFKKIFFNKFNVELKCFYQLMIAIINQQLIYKKLNNINHSTYGRNTAKAIEINLLIKEMSITIESLKKEIEKIKNASNKDQLLEFERILRKKPLLCINENETLIIDPTLLVEFATIGPLFQIAKPGERDAFKEYGDCFEKYVQSHLQRICNNEKPSLINNENLKRGIKKDGELEIDSYIKAKNNSIILIETKSSFLNELNDYYEELNQKYLEQKGIKQLKDRIELFCSENKCTEIFPILLVRDNLLPNTEFYLNNHLKESLELKNENKTSPITIHPLIILSIDILEKLPFDIDLYEFFSAYYDYLNRQEIYINTLDDFLVNSEYGKNLFVSKHAVDKILTILKESKNLLFPNNRDQST